jgi:hypothetical protein
VRQPLSNLAADSAPGACNQCNFRLWHEAHFNPQSHFCKR